MNHDTSVSETLLPEDEETLGLLGRDSELQFVRLAAAYNKQRDEIIRLRCALWSIRMFGRLHPGCGFSCAAAAMDALEGGDL